MLAFFFDSRPRKSGLFYGLSTMDFPSFDRSLNRVINFHIILGPSLGFRERTKEAKLVRFINPIPNHGNFSSLSRLIKQTNSEKYDTRHSAAAATDKQNVVQELSMKCERLINISRQKLNTFQSSTAKLQKPVAW